MKRSTARWTTAFAAAALFALPAAGLSQTPPTPSSQQPPSSASQDKRGAALEHIKQAQTALNDVQAASVPARAKSKITELKRHLSSLEKTASAGSPAAAKPTARGKANWATEVAAIDKILTELIGPATASPAAEPPAAAGTTGQSKTAPLTLDETTKTKLMEVRTHVTAFAASMSGTGAPSPGAEPSTDPAAASAAPAAAQTSATAPAQPPAAEPTQPAAAPPAQAPASTTPATTPAASPEQAQPPASTQGDPEAAKRHLTAARDALSQLTQLPAAAQLQGDSRTQVSQVISNFNELITAKENWRASYDKVNSSLMSLLGPETAEPAAAPATPPATGTPGAVGTTGTTGLDPAIRAKLVEFKSHLAQFEKAAGVGAGMSSAAPEQNAAAPSAAASPASSAATSPASSAATSPAPSAAAPPAQSAATPERPEAGAPAPQPSEAMQAGGSAIGHIDAIEAILNARTSASAQTPTGAAGALTLEPAQVEQLRTHLAQLRKAIEKK